MSASGHYPWCWTRWDHLPDECNCDGCGSGWPSCRTNVRQGGSPCCMECYHPVERPIVTNVQHFHQDGTHWAPGLPVAESDCPTPGEVYRDGDEIVLREAAKAAAARMDEANQVARRAEEDWRQANDAHAAHIVAKQTRRATICVHGNQRGLCAECRMVERG